MYIRLLKRIQLTNILRSNFRCVQEKSINTNSPIGYCASKLSVQNCNCLDNDDENVFIWNTVNGQLILSIEMPDFRSYLLDFRLALNSHGYTSAETPFNELLGINGMSISTDTYAVYTAYANILAHMLGVGGCSDPVALINLNALVVFPTELATLNCYLSVKSPLGCLAYVKNIYVLVQEMTAISVILDGYAHWNAGFTFLDSLYPSKTKSNYIISHLIGNKGFLPLIGDAVRCLATSLYGPDGGDLLIEILTTVAVNDNVANVGLSALYKEPANCCYEIESVVINPNLNSRNRADISTFDFENV